LTLEGRPDKQYTIGERLLSSYFGNQSVGQHAAALTTSAFQIREYPCWKAWMLIGTIKLRRVCVSLSTCLAA